MNVSIKTRIYLSFLVLVSLFIISGSITMLVLKDNKKASIHISEVADPSLEALHEFRTMMNESMMFTTNWVFIRSAIEDKNSLKSIQADIYPSLKKQLNVLSVRWKEKKMVDSLQYVFAGFEQAIADEKVIMNQLRTFEDYNDPIKKFEAEEMLESTVLPKIVTLSNTLNGILLAEKQVKAGEGKRLATISTFLRTLITVFAISTVCLGIFFSIYMTKKIIWPIRQIRNIINDLGKGITNKVEYKVRVDEIGMMVQSINNLSDKLSGTANFANEIGNRNFTANFQPLSEEDTLGKALIAMRDNLNNSDRRLMDANAEIQTVFNASLDAVIIVDEAGKIVKWDHKAEELFGWKEEQAMGLTLSETIIPARYREKHEEGMRHFLKTGEGTLLGKTIEIHAMTKDNNEIDISLSVTPSLIREQKRFIGFIRDITQRKKAEAELQRKNRELEQFAYVASHDLQEPLRTISSFVDLLQQQYRGKFDATADKYLTYVLQSSDRMKVLVNDLLDYSRIGKKTELQRVDCHIIMDNVLADLAVAIKDSKAEIEVGVLPVINGYPTEIKQLFQNLVMNAIKFKKKTEIPKVKIDAKKNGAGWYFSVADNGIGIDEQHKDRIFIIFQRLHTRTEYEGSGIGLAHCKKIVELHGGRIWINSVPGEGSTFNFYLAQNNN